MTCVTDRHRNPPWIVWTSLLLIVFSLASCHRRPPYSISRSYHVSAEKLAEIRSNPHIKTSVRGPGPSARLAGVGDDRWPGGILFLHTDPYLQELGLDKGTMIAEIDGKKAQDLFLQKWGKDAGAFEEGHYNDLIDYLFIDHEWHEVVLTVYLDVPRSFDEVDGYKPKIEHWLLKIG